MTPALADRFFTAEPAGKLQFIVWNRIFRYFEDGEPSLERGQHFLRAHSKSVERGKMQTWGIWLCYSAVVQSPGHVRLFGTPWTARPPCPSPSPGVCPSSCPLIQCFHPTVSSSVAFFSFCLQSFPVSGSLPMSQLFASGGQSIGVSASILQKSIQGWFTLRLTGLISLLSKGLSRVFPASQFKSINSLVLCLPYCPDLTSVHDYWKDHSLDYMGLCWQRDVFAF